MRTWAALLALVLVGCWPFLYVLPLQPESRDAVIWITRGAVTEDWVGWVLRSEHFVGWRPVTAFSYTVDSMLGGYAPLPYRATDLGLHAACAAAVFLLHRRLVPQLPAWGGLVASATMLLHPVAGLVVPHLARRAYPLATLLSLLGLVALLDRRRAGPIVGAVLLGLGALANEAAFVAVPAAAVLALLRARGLRETVRLAGPAVAVAAVLVAARFVVVGGAGGYAVEKGARWAPILWASAKGLAGLESFRTGVVAPPDALAAVVGVAVLGGLLLPAVRRPPLDDAAVATAFAASWVAGILLVYLPQGVFFPRQLYVPLAPWALLTGVAASSAAVAADPARRAAMAGSVVVALLAVGWQSPVLRGPDPLQAASWKANDRLLRDMEADLRDVPRKAFVDVVLPYHRRPEMDALRAREADEQRFVGRQALTWFNKVHGVKFGEVMLYLVDPREEPPPVRLEERADGTVVVLPRGVEPLNDPGRRKVVPTLAGTEVHLARSPARDRPVYLYFHDGRSGRLLPPEVP